MFMVKGGGEIKGFGESSLFAPRYTKETIPGGVKDGWPGSASSHATRPPELRMRLASQRRYVDLPEF